MDIPYNGYTIIPNSERQPDGRWLPVAELEVSHRGVVTSRPPLRAAPREIRATRTDADATAVKMAKAWIDASERENTTTRASTQKTNDKDRSSTLVARDVASARIPQKTRAQDAPARDATRVRVTDDKKAPPLKADWAGLYQALGLDSDERVDHLTRVLVVHFLLDRLITVILATKLASSSDEATLSSIVPLPIETRGDLASILGMITPGVAKSIVEINHLRNRLVHFRPTPGKPAWDVGDADEIASQDACDKGLRKGLEAVQKLMSAL